MIQQWQNNYPYCFAQYATYFLKLISGCVYNILLKKLHRYSVLMLRTISDIQHYKGTFKLTTASSK